MKKRTLTSWPSVRTDIRNAGGHWVDEEVVTDRNLTTSRKPDDFPAFNERLIREFSQGQVVANKTHYGEATARLLACSRIGHLRGVRCCYLA